MTADAADPRYSLANERTYLAWIRTSLGLLASAAGLMAIELPWPTPAVRALAALLAVAGGASALLGWRRWNAVEAAIEAGQAAPPPRAHVLLSLTVVSATVILLVLIIL